VSSSSTKQTPDKRGGAYSKSILGMGSAEKGRDEELQPLGAALDELNARKLGS
jgi:hypothetical protein